MFRSISPIHACVVSLGVLLVPASSWACTAVLPSGCVTSEVDDSALHPPANAPAIRLRRSHDRAWGPGPDSEVRWLRPDGGIVFGDLEDFGGGDALYTSSEPLEPGPGYVLEVEEFCIDGAWNPDAGFVRSFAVEVTEPIEVPPEAPAPIGTITVSEPETVVEEVLSLGSDCTRAKTQVRFARATVRFTPDPAWRAALPRTAFEVGGDLGSRRFPMGTVREGGMDVSFERPCDQLDGAEDFSVRVLAEIPGKSPSPLGVASGRIRLQCSPAIGSAGCGVVDGTFSVASAFGLSALALLFVRRRSHEAQ